MRPAGGQPPPRWLTQHVQLSRGEEPEQAAAACGPTRGKRRGMTTLPAVHGAWRTRDLSVDDITSFERPSA